MRWLLADQQLTEESVSLLVPLGEPGSDAGGSMLHLALECSTESCNSIVDLLLQDSRLNQESRERRAYRDGLSPLYLACYWKKWPAVKALLMAGADVNNSPILNGGNKITSKMLIDYLHKMIDLLPRSEQKVICKIRLKLAATYILDNQLNKAIEQFALARKMGHPIPAVDASFDMTKPVERCLGQQPQPDYLSLLAQVVDSPMKKLIAAHYLHSADSCKKECEVILSKAKPYVAALSDLYGWGADKQPNLLRAAKQFGELAEKEKDVLLKTEAYQLQALAYHRWMLDERCEEKPVYLKLAVDALEKAYRPNGLLSALRALLELTEDVDVLLRCYEYEIARKNIENMAAVARKLMLVLKKNQGDNNALGKVSGTLIAICKQQKDLSVIEAISSFLREQQDSGLCQVIQDIWFFQVSKQPLNLVATKNAVEVSEQLFNLLGAAQEEKAEEGKPKKKDNRQERQLVQFGYAMGCHVAALFDVKNKAACVGDQLKFAKEKVLILLKNPENVLLWDVISFQLTTCHISQSDFESGKRIVDFVSGISNQLEPASEIKNRVLKTQAECMGRQATRKPDVAALASVVAAYDEQKAVSPALVSALKSQAAILIQTQKYDDAFSIYSRKELSGDAEALLGLGYIYYIRQKYADAITRYAQGVSKHNLTAEELANTIKIITTIQGIIPVAEKKTHDDINALLKVCELKQQMHACVARKKIGDLGVLIDLIKTADDFAAMKSGLDVLTGVLVQEWRGAFSPMRCAAYDLVLNIACKDSQAAVYVIEQLGKKIQPYGEILRHLQDIKRSLGGAEAAKTTTLATGETGEEEEWESVRNFPSAPSQEGQPQGNNPYAAAIPAALADRGRGVGGGAGSASAYQPEREGGPEEQEMGAEAAAAAAPPPGGPSPHVALALHGARAAEERKQEASAAAESPAAEGQPAPSAPPSGEPPPSPAK